MSEKKEKIITDAEKIDRLYRDNQYLRKFTILGFFKYLGFFCIFVLTLKGLQATPSEQWLNDECSTYNYTFQECLDFRESFTTNFTDTNTISNETQLILDLKDDFNNKYDDFRSEFSDNLSDINSNIDRLDFSEFNDSEQIENTKNFLLDKISSLDSKYNKLTGNVSTEFNLNQIINTQMQLQVAKETQKQIKDIFSEDEDKDKGLNLSNYVTTTQLNQKGFITSTPSLEGYAKTTYLVVLFVGVLIVVGYIYVNDLKVLKDEIEILKNNNTKLSLSEITQPQDIKEVEQPKPSEGVSNEFKI